MNNFINLTKEACYSEYQPRRPEGHKGTFGKVLIMAGSEEYPGAGVMAALGALRSGVGIVTLALPESLRGAFPFWVPPEIILRYLPAKDGGFYLSPSQAVGICSGFDSILVGSGWGRGDSRFDCLSNVSEACKNGILLLDADALNLIAEHKAYDMLDNCTGKTIITPHVAEFARLLHKNSLDLSLQSRLDYSINFAAKHHCVVVQKSASTIITDSRKNYVCQQANSGLGKGGSGDLLAGLIAGIAAYKPYKEPISAAMLGVYLHSQAGLIAKENLTENAMTISDVASLIPQAWKRFLTNN